MKYYKSYKSIPYYLSTVAYYIFCHYASFFPNSETQQPRPLGLCLDSKWPESSASDFLKALRASR